MTVGRFLSATVAGGVALFLLGYLIWGWALMGFFQSHAGTATGAFKEAPDFLFLVLGQLFWAAFLTLLIGHWAGVSGFGPAFKVGAIAGVLTSLGFDLTMYATTNLNDLTATLTDPVLSIVYNGVAAGIIGVVLAKGGSTTA